MDDPTTEDRIEARKAKARARAKAWYWANRDRAKAYDRTRDRATLRARKARWVSENLDHVKAKRRAYYMANKEETKERSAAWRRANPERFNAQMRSWHARNPGKQVEVDRRRRARLANSGAYLVTERDWFRLRSRHDHRCAYCGRRRPLERDHVVPVSRGGTHAIGNLLPACRECNASKGQRLLTEWRTHESRVDHSMGGGPDE